MTVRSTVMEKKSGRGFNHLTKAFCWSMKGLREAIRHEEAFRQELILFFIFTPLAVWLGNNGLERALLIGSLFIVLVAELLNSALEAVVDRFGGEWDVLSGRAKDLGSAAVFLSILNVIVIWILILFF